MSPLVRDFRALSTNVETFADLTALIEAVSRDLGFEYVAVLHSTSLLRCSSRLIRFDNYPVDWSSHLVRNGETIVDPVLAVARRRVSGFLWPDALRGMSLSSSQLTILDEAARIGIRQGITVPANVPGEPEGSISFATRHRREVGRERMMMADAIGHFAFDAARRLTGVACLPDPVPQISDRERQCIYWIAHGKTDQDAADILGVRLETVRTYVKKAFRKVGVITRGQLVHEALRLGLIDFDPSIPPFG